MSGGDGTVFGPSLSAAPAIPPARPPQTFSAAHLRRQRDAHARADGYGRHRHLYLQDTFVRLARRLRDAAGRPGIDWLDYGCGKGTFIDQIAPFGLFNRISGYDPAVEAFRSRPQRRHDLVTCLDVLDVVEPRFRAELLEELAALASGVVLLDCLTRPRPGGALQPHPPFYWSTLVRQHLKVLATRIEFAGMDGFERVLILAAPSAGVPAAPGITLD